MVDTCKNLLRPAALLLTLLLPASGVLAAEAGDYAPANILKADKMLGWLCMINATCPVSAQVRSVITRAIANDRAAEYLLGLTLLTGDGLPRDRAAGMVWVVRAAEQGEPDAARNVAGRMRNGEAIQIDETKVAAGR